jgi:hypothetical protein
MRGGVKEQTDAWEKRIDDEAASEAGEGYPVGIKCKRNSCNFSLSGTVSLLQLNPQRGQPLGPE